VAFKPRKEITSDPFIKYDSLLFPFILKGYG